MLNELRHCLSCHENTVMRTSPGKIFLFLLAGIPSVTLAQTNIYLSNAQAANVLAGHYDPSVYASSQPFTDPHLIAQDINTGINADSLRSYLERMSAFETRNSGSDTVSHTRGMGAARRWAYRKLKTVSEANEDRLLVGYLQFDRNICGQQQHRNVVAVLPGMAADSANGLSTGVVIIEAHLDSRCGTSCDTGCLAQGMEDNGSGSALVLELARVMSRYQFNRTIVFMLTTAEEQGLLGAEAMASYCDDNDIPVAAVLNNDVIGGVLCGKTSSPPSCPGENDVDSTQVRLFSMGILNSPHKQLARYIKLQYNDELLPWAGTPMQITVMTAEDRTGRGGDHIPFRQHNFTAMRFTSANEHGDGNPSQAGYDDRQHTSDDILGVDTDGDNVPDSFFVDFRYLARNTAINGVAAAMIAQNMCTPEVIQVEQLDWKTLQCTLAGDWCHGHPALIALRTETNDWDTLIYTEEGITSFEVEPGHTYFISAAYLDENLVESLFTGEVMVDVVGVDDSPRLESGIQLLQNRPNPFDESTAIAFMVYDMPKNPQAAINIRDAAGHLVQSLPVNIRPGANEVIYEHGYGKAGTFFYSLIIDDTVIDTKKMVFTAN